MSGVVHGMSSRKKVKNIIIPHTMGRVQCFNTDKKANFIIHVCTYYFNIDKVYLLKTVEIHT